MGIKLLEGILRPGGLDITQRLVDMCAFGPGAPVLDLGCGAGVTVEYLINQCGLKAVGMDKDAARLEQARRRVPDLPVILGRGESLPFDSASFDGVLAECSLSVMHYQGAVLGELYRVLRTGGKLAISDLYRRPTAEHRDHCHAAMGGGITGVNDVTPVDGGCLSGAKTAGQLKDVLASHGFRLLVWHDATPSLKVFVAQYIMTHGDLDGSWLMAGEACARGVNKKKLGYFYAVAERMAGG